MKGYFLIIPSILAFLINHVEGSSGQAGTSAVSAIPAQERFPLGRTPTDKEWRQLYDSVYGRMSTCKDPETNALRRHVSDLAAINICNILQHDIRPQEDTTKLQEIVYKIKFLLNMTSPETIIPGSQPPQSLLDFAKGLFKNAVEANQSGNAIGLLLLGMRFIDPDLYCEHKEQDDFRIYSDTLYGCQDNSMECQNILNRLKRFLKSKNDHALNQRAEELRDAFMAPYSNFKWFEMPDDFKLKGKEKEIFMAFKEKFPMDCETDFDAPVPMLNGKSLRGFVFDYGVNIDSLYDAEIMIKKYIIALAAREVANILKDLRVLKDSDPERLHHIFYRIKDLMRIATPTTKVPGTNQSLRAFCRDIENGEMKLPLILAMRYIDEKTYQSSINFYDKTSNRKISDLIYSMENSGPECAKIRRRLERYLKRVQHGTDCHVENQDLMNPDDVSTVKVVEYSTPSQMAALINDTGSVVQAFQGMSLAESMDQEYDPDTSCMQPEEEETSSTTIDVSYDSTAYRYSNATYGYKNDTEMTSSSEEKDYESSDEDSGQETTTSSYDSDEGEYDFDGMEQ